MRISRHPYPRQHSRGFSLLENMIALIILSVGLLGIAGLQAFTLKSGTISAGRLVAIQQANQMADRIKANIAAIYNPADGDPKYDDISPSALAGFTIDCNSMSCSPQQMAVFDEETWINENNLLLPGTPGFKGGYVRAVALNNNLDGTPSLLYPIDAGGTVGPTRLRYTIAMYWDAQRTGTTTGPIGATPTGMGDYNCPPQSVNDMECYILEIDL